MNNGTIVGYAYAGMFHEREAYSRCVETSIYVDNNMKHMGIGGILHKALEDELRKDGFLNMYACISCPKKEDEYLNRNSIEFHSHLGYRLVGEFYDCGYKFKDGTIWSGWKSSSGNILINKIYNMQKRGVV